jgi:hypothetical protein
MYTGRLAEGSTIMAARLLLGNMALGLTTNHLIIE